MASAPPGMPTTSVRRKHVPPAAPYVLVVDDSEDNRDLYSMYFAHAGFRVEEAVDGKDALAKITKQSPHVVIMDLAMPKMDGWEATRLIKSNPRTRGVIVVALTGHPTALNLDRAEAAGADVVVAKPCLPETLLAMVRLLLVRAAR
jgi:two-component system, cell cycle response regulator DivK